VRLLHSTRKRLDQKEVAAMHSASLDLLVTAFEVQRNHQQMHPKTRVC
jgi:hypothetical protein